MIKWILTFSLAPTFGWAAPVKGSIAFSGDTVHLELAGQTQWNYELTREEGKKTDRINLIVDPIAEGTLVQLKQFTSDFVKKIEINKNGPDGKYIISFETGKDVESFDYLTDQPSRLIVDFFKNLPATKSEKTAKAPSQETPSPKAEVKAQDNTQVESKNEKRQPANDVLVVAQNGIIQKDNPLTSEVRTGIFDGGDPEFQRFSIKDYEIKESAILAARENIYVEFPILRIEVPYLANMINNPPIYEITPKNTEENKQARLLLTLFNKKRNAVFLKTEKWFTQKYPESEYSEMIKFMTADVHYRLWLEQQNVVDYDLAMLRYRQAIEKYPQSALVERTWMLMGFAALDRGDALGALRLFQKHLDERKNSPNRDLARLALANAFLKLKNYEESLNQFKLVEGEANTDKFKFDAAFSRGDVYRQRAPLAQNEKQMQEFFQKAVNEYKEALLRYPMQAGNYPNAWYNQAEAQFGLKKYKEVLETHREFVKRFPSHDYAGFAMTRMGEMLDVLGADKSRVMGAYLETFFRYGESPAALVARIRLVSQRMKGMKDKEVEPIVSEIMDLGKKSDLNRIQEFTTVMVSDGYSSRKNYEKAIDLLHTFYQANPTTANKSMLGARIVKHINEKMHDEVNAGNFIAALSTHGKHIREPWLKGSDRVDTRYFLGRAYELAGVPQEADTYYRETLNRYFGLKATGRLKEVAAVENLPAEEELNLRLAAISSQIGQYQKSYDYIKAIKKPELLSEKEQIERIQLAAHLMDKRGDLESAVRYLGDLLNTWKGIPELMAEPFFDLAQMEERMGRKSEAMRSYERIREMQKQSGKVHAETYLKSMQSLVELKLQDKKTQEGIEILDDLLNEFEGKKELSSLRYKLGKLHFDKGEMQKAAEVWKNLKGKNNDLWYNIAQENLKNAQWGDDYKKYMKRIPAMANENINSENKSGAK